MHKVGGAKKVVLTAPSKDDIMPTFVMGVNEDTDMAPGRIGRVESLRRLVRSKRVRQYALSGGFPYVSFSPLPGKGRQAESQCHEEQDGQGVGIVAAGTEEVSEVAVKFRCPEPFRTDRTGIVFDLETIDVYPTS